LVCHPFLWSFYIAAGHRDTVLPIAANAGPDIAKRQRIGVIADPGGLDKNDL